MGGRGCAALTQDLGRDPLSDLADRPAVSVTDEVAVRAALDVDEPRRNDEPPSVDALPRAGRMERTRRSNARDAITGDADVAIEPPRSRAVDDPAVLDDDVERSGRNWPSVRTPPGRARGEHGEAGKQREMSVHFSGVTEREGGRPQP